MAIVQIANAYHNVTTSVGVVSLNDNCTDSAQLLAQVAGACRIAQNHAMTQLGMVSVA